MPDRSCPICWTVFTVPDRRPKTYCSARCSRAAYDRRRRQPNEAPDPVGSTPAPLTERACPHCGEPITVVALLTTAQAARATPPTNTDRRPRRMTLIQ